ncbi:hypothetical protein FA04_14535 [Ensifer adhaerens]|nr:hypothetical protein FA04_14535 [Ensifer adhaerens]KDP70309.1 hypothetical protein FA04_29175 [Ensifer adhaerens]
MDFLRTNNMALTQLGLGLLSGQNAQQQAALGAQGLAQGINTNKTMQFLAKSYPDLAQAVQSGAMSPGDAWKMAYTQKLEAAKPKNNFMAVGKNLYNAETGQWVTPPAGVGGDDVEAGLNLVYGQDTEGNTVGFQPLKSGGLRRVDVPEGVRLTPGTSSVDLGTSIGIRDNKSGAIIQQVPKDLAGAERQKEIGTAEGKNIAAAPGDLQAGRNAKDIITQLKTDPNRQAGTGWSGWAFNSVPATPGYDYQNKVNQAKSGAFLTAIQQMRGLGALSNAEGDAATKAVTRMDTATSEEAFVEALNDYEKIIDQGIARAQSRLQGGSSAPAATQGARLGGTTGNGVKWSVE